MDQPTPHSVPAEQWRLSSRSWRCVLTLILFAFGVRIGLLLVLNAVTHGREFADDFKAYRMFYDNPFVLISTQGIEVEPGVIVYSPLIPLQVYFPGKLLGSLFGEFIGQRLAMILYDMVATAVTAYVMVRYFPAPWNRRDWLAAMLLMCVPGSIGASALWGQEDSIAAMWTSFAMLAIVLGHPTISAMFGALGLFTHKLFALLLSLGIWVASRGARLKIFIATSGITAVFFLFLFIRWKFTNMLGASYAYNAVFNSPSPWSLADRIVGTGTLSFDNLRPFIMLTTTLALIGVSFPLRRRRLIPEATIVATHGTFFIVFVGIQPEHHQWFMPFLIYFAWRRWLARDWLAFASAWGFSACAYGYKIAYGLQARESNSSEGKEIFRQWLGDHSAQLLDLTQLTFHLLTLIVGITLVWRATVADEVQLPRRNPA